MAKAVADRGPDRRGARRRARRGAPTPGRRATWPAPGSTCGRATWPTPSTTWPAPSTWWSATRRTSRTRPGSRWRSRCATTTPQLALYSERRRARRDPRRRGPGRAAAAARGLGRRRARRRPGRARAGRVQRHRAVGRGARPPGPGRACAVPDRAAGTMSPMSEQVEAREHDVPHRVRRGAGGRDRGGRAGRPARRAGRAARPTPSTASAPTPSTTPPCRRCSTPRAGAARCRRRCWSAPRPRSPPSPPTCQAYVAALVEAFWPGPLTLVCEQQPSLHLGPRRDPGHGRGADARPRGRPRRCSSAPARSRSARPTSAGCRPRPRPTAADGMLGDSVEVVLDGGPRPGARPRPSST